MRGGADETEHLPGELGLLPPSLVSVRKVTLISRAVEREEWLANRQPVPC